MKKKLILFLVLIIASGILISMKSIFVTTSGPHGGQVKNADTYNIEAKVVSSNFYTYLLNSVNKPVGNKNMTCEIQFFLLDGTTLDVPMKKYEEEGFTMEYFLLDFNSYKITFTESGKMYSAKFDMENVLVHK